MPRTCDLLAGPVGKDRFFFEHLRFAYQNDLCVNARIRSEVSRATRRPLTSSRRVRASLGDESREGTESPAKPRNTHSLSSGEIPEKCLPINAAAGTVGKLRIVLECRPQSMLNLPLVGVALRSLVPQLLVLDPNTMRLPLDLADDDLVRNLFVATLLRQSDLGADINRLSDGTANLIAEIIAAKNQLAGDHQALQVLNALQFCAATGVLGQCVVTSQLSRAADWLLASLNDHLPIGAMVPPANVEVGRLAGLASSKRRFLQENGTLFACQWAAQAFLYMRRLRAYPELGQAAARICWDMAMAELNKGAKEGCEAALRIVEWAVKVGHECSTDMVRALETLFERTPIEMRLMIAGTFTSAVGGLSNYPLTHWTDFINDHWNEADPAVRLASLIAKIVDDGAFATHSGQLARVFEDFNANALEAPPFFREQHLESVFRAIHPLLYHLLPNKRLTEVLELLANWYSIPKMEALTDALLVAPHLPSGVLWMSAASAQEIQQDADDILSRLIHSANRALRIVITDDRGQTGLSAPHDPGKEGLPNDDFANEFEAACTEALGLVHLNVATLPSTDVCAILMTSITLPFQALTTRAFGRCWPLSVSLKKPRTDRRVRTVGIWFHPVLHADKELEIVEAVLAQAGRRYILERSGGHDERARFQQLYSNANLDVMWIIGHGAKPAYQPDNSALHIFENGRIDANDFAELPIPDNKNSRLLVLNVCSGGATVCFGGLPRVSLAALVAGPLQKTVAHLWPANSLSATVFGGLLIDQLTRTERFFDAYQASLLNHERTRQRCDRCICRFARRRCRDGQLGQPQCQPTSGNLQRRFHSVSAMIGPG